MAGGEVLGTPNSWRLPQLRDKGQGVGDCQRDVPAPRDTGMCHPGLAAASSTTGQPGEAAQAAAGVGGTESRAGDTSELALCQAQGSQ